MFTGPSTLYLYDPEPPVAVIPIDPVDAHLDSFVSIVAVSSIQFCARDIDASKQSNKKNNILR